MTLGDKLYHLRRKLRISQANMGKMIGSCRQAISKYENDQAEPGWYVMVKIAKVLGVSLDYFAKEDENEIQS